MNLSKLNFEVWKFYLFYLNAPKMDDSKYKEKKLQYFKEEGHWLIYYVAFISLAFLSYTYYSYFKLSK